MEPKERLTDEDKVLKVREYKKKGNAAHKEGHFSKAAKDYYRAILYIKGLSINCPDIASAFAPAKEEGAAHQSNPKISPELEADIRSLTCDCYNNLAACMLKEPEPKYRRIIEYCDKALEASPLNVKSVYRRGTSLFALGDYDDALTTFEKASTDPSVKKYIQLCKEKIKQRDKELAVKYKSMFKS